LGTGINEWWMLNLFHKRVIASTASAAKNYVIRVWCTQEYKRDEKKNNKNVDKTELIINQYK
jgi:hypothetical protein